MTDQRPKPRRFATKDGAFLEIEADVIRVGNAEGGLELGPDGMRCWHRDGSLVLVGGAATVTAQT